MNIDKSLTAFILAVSISLQGCQFSKRFFADSPVLETELVGLPLAVSSQYDTVPSLSVMVQVPDGSYRLCNSVGSDWYVWDKRHVLQAQTILLSEINDSDRQEIILRGRPDINMFSFTAVTANGYTVDIVKR
jgi:hypothetical protein